MKIIVDMMGGDNAPLAVLEGAAQAVKEYGITVVGLSDMRQKLFAENHTILSICADSGQERRSRL